MPSSKYFRSVLPIDLLQIVGLYAGDENYKLKFTFSPKRRFLSNILLVWRDPTLYSEHIHPTIVLRREHWVPVRLNRVGEVLTLLTERCKLPENVLLPSLKRITNILLEIHDYRISRNMRKVW